MRNFGSHIGRAEVADEVYGPNFTELWISIDPDVDYHATLKKIQAAMDGYPGMFCDVQTYLKERSKEVLSGTSCEHRRAAVRPGPGRCCGRRRRRSRR